MTIQLGILIQQTPQRTTTLCLVEGGAQCNLKERNRWKNASEVLLGEQRRERQSRVHAAAGRLPQCKWPGMEGWATRRWWKWGCCWSGGTSHLPRYPDLTERSPLTLQLEERQRTELSPHQPSESTRVD